MNENQIRSALSNARLSTADKQNVEGVLLVQDRRRSYDHAWQLLQDIGQLRANLGLLGGECWTAPEFNARPGTRSEIDRLARTGPSIATGSAPLVRASLRPVIPVLGFIALLALVVWIDGSIWPDHKKKATAKAPKEIPAEPAFSVPTKELPSSGIVDIGAGSRIAPFELVTRGEESHYYVKLIDPSTNRMALEVFVRGGERLNVKAPLGTYEMRYAAGQVWYGFKHLFGPSTYYGKADVLFEFSQEGRRVSGHTVELFMQDDGNLPTRAINPDAF